MRQYLIRGFVVALILCGTVAAQSQPKSVHSASAPAELTWGPAPPVFEAGAMMAVVAGDPSKPGPFVVRLKAPAGYKINPHFHPTDENVTVISGQLAIGMGDKFDAKAMKVLPTGGFTLLPADMHHFAMFKTAGIVQVHGMGPFQLTYVNPNDDPTKRVKK